ncbi:Meso-diaminopimelate D-dehydrogenase [Candidatus Syntrophocurvum alkaliphilum]|uniref:Meso-diaminopimelate D-dehydrogenase n=1 Tax=Candidatus Syntrophocurvum alkaliphilum TaxID=2293317 RepID=A0A6I6DDZ9_9FIRM|nr:diaminopimelate dehydrogenase [Candidatus Syntrophocurvum alkaliphilum]QGT99407.1 Meso-diaminopimelate D-dehydrogenase [Candidatus Syntrophocurvum alkaliphilum]
MSKTKVAIVGYGNIGKFAVDAINEAPDMELVGVVRRASSLSQPKPSELADIPVVASIKELPDVKIALLCTPTRSVPEYASEILSLGINTVDSYDIHGDLADMKIDLDKIAKQHKSVAVISAGWDPGTDAMLRCIFEIMAPKGITYTNFGPGMSMGHSVAVRSKDGIKNALSMTIPLGTSVHRRMVYVELEEGASFDKVEESIKTDSYFAKDETHVIQVDDVDNLVDMGHGVSMERKGASGITQNQLLKFDMRINNPALTAQVMVSSARASLNQQPGAYTMIEIPIIDFMHGDKDKIIRDLV